MTDRVDEHPCDHPLLAALRETHAWTDVSGAPAGGAGPASRAAARDWIVIRDRYAPGAPWHRCVHVGVYADGSAVVEDTTIDDQRVRYRAYHLRPHAPGAAARVAAG